ncbi:hypothetical protein BGZ60DRAFT_437869 [Tricladium varicosporioides]|nr:hypothetical protein BGZ60DRAFT_437869 [Hymenoscyphus varicosporioides]
MTFYDLYEWILNQDVDPNINPDLLNRSYELSSGASSDNIGEDTVEALNDAAALGDIEIFDLFVKHGAVASNSIALRKVSLCDDPIAATAMVDHLVEKYKFDVNADDTCGGLRWDLDLGETPAIWGSPLDCAVKHGNAAVVGALLKHKANIANCYGSPQGDEINWDEFSKGCLLHMAINTGSIEIVKYLLDADRSYIGKLCETYGGKFLEDTDIDKDKYDPAKYGVSI